MTYAIAYLVSLLVMAGLDFLWLTNTSAALYRRDLGPLLAEQPRMGVAVVFYLAYAAGVVIFAVRPALAAADWRAAALYGALFGFFALYHLRPDQFRHHESVDFAGHAIGHWLGHASDSRGRRRGRACGTEIPLAG